MNTKVLLSSHDLKWLMNFLWRMQFSFTINFWKCKLPKVIVQLKVICFLQLREIGNEQKHSITVNVMALLSSHDLKFLWWMQFFYTINFRKRKLPKIIMQLKVICFHQLRKIFENMLLKSLRSLSSLKKTIIENLPFWSINHIKWILAINETFYFLK